MQGDVQTSQISLLRCMGCAAASKRDTLAPGSRQTPAVEDPDLPTALAPGKRDMMQRLSLFSILCSACSAPPELAMHVEGAE